MSSFVIEIYVVEDFCTDVLPFLQAVVLFGWYVSADSKKTRTNTTVVGRCGPLMCQKSRMRVDQIIIKMFQYCFVFLLMKVCEIVCNEG